MTWQSSPETRSAARLASPNMTSPYPFRDTSALPSSASPSSSRLKPIAASATRRKQVGRYSTSANETGRGDEDVDPYDRPPILPDKLYPSKLDKGQSSSSFNLDPAGKEDRGSAQSSRTMRASPAKVLTPSPRQANLSYIPSPQMGVSIRESSQSARTDEVHSRDADEGRVSGVVTTANAISLQRAAARTRAAAEIVTITSPPSSSQHNKPARSSVEKGIGVTTRRRKSREGAIVGGGRSSIENRLNAIAMPTNGVKNNNSKGASSGLSPAPTTRSLSRNSDDEANKSVNASRAGSLTPNGRSNPTNVSNRDENTSQMRKTASPLLKASVSTALRMRGSSNSSVESPAESYDQSQPSRRYLSPSFSSFDIDPSTFTNNTSVGGSLDGSKQAWGRNAIAATELSADYALSSATHHSTRPRNISNASAASSMASRSAMLTAKEANAPLSESLSRSKMSTSSSLSNQAGDMESPTCDKDTLLNQLLSSMALIDSQPYTALVSIDEVEVYKKELSKVEKRMTDVRHKLKVEMRVRDAADKLRRAGTRQNQHSRNASIASVAMGGKMGGQSHQRGMSIASTAGPVAAAEVAQAEADVASAIKRTDATNNELLHLKERSMTLQKKLLEHQTRVLALRVSSLEEERARHLDRVEEEVSNQSGVVQMATEEVEDLQERLGQTEEALRQEKRLREEDASRWRLKYEQSCSQSSERLEAEKKSWRHLIEEEKKRSEATVQRMQRNHSQEVVNLNAMKEAAEQRLQEQMTSKSVRREHEEQIANLQQQLEQAEFETTAERKIMMERQKLFTAFERRLNRAEVKLREQDDRCARMLGKVDGREEMDTMLEQIKSGYGAVKKEKTAGQDVDGLIDSIATHIGDLDDELQRSFKSPAMSSRGFESQFNSRDQELQAWKAEAETAKKSLAAYQRQSTLSVASGGGGLSPHGRSKRHRSGSINESETESRLALIEKQKEALEIELQELKQKGKPSAFSSRSSRELELLTDAMHNLLSILPVLDPSNMDLSTIQVEMTTGGKQSNSSLFDDVKEVCQEVIHRCRSLVTTSTRIVDRTMASESRLEAFKNDLVDMESKCDGLKRAMEDMRKGNETHLEREKKLQSTVNELRRSLTAKNMNDFAGYSSRGSSEYGPSREPMGLPGIMTRSRSSGSIQSYAQATPVVLVREPSLSSSFGTSASQRRTRGIPKPLSISTSNSNLSFTLSSSQPRHHQSASRTMDTIATTPPPAIKRSATSASSASGKTPPRSMTLGMDAIQMRERIRHLEADLISATRTTKSATQSRSTFASDLQREDLVHELQEQRRELDYVKSVESKQRIDLLDELTNLTGELSETRAQLREAQHRQITR